MSADEKPPEKETVKFEAVPDWAIKLTQKVGDGFANMDTRMDTFEANQRVQGGQIGVVEKEISLIWEWKGEVNEWRKGASLRAKQPSSADLENEAKLAVEIVKNQERDRKIEETHALAAAAAETLKAQSDYMGMGKRGAQWLVSKEGRTAMAQAAAALVAFYEVIKHAGVIK